MEANRTTVSTSIELALEPMIAFNVFGEELTVALTQSGMAFETGTNGRITEGEFEVGRVITWKPGELVQLEWHQADWETEEVTTVEIRFEPINGGTRVTLEHRGWGGLIGQSTEVAGWFARTVAAPFLQATSPKAFGNWLTDRRARRPSGAQARDTYRDPLYH